MKGKHAQARVDELLSAYLDGELSPREQARLETRLAADPALRARLKTLRHTVALVRNLPQVEAPRNFLLTPTMVTSARPQPVRRRWLAPALTFATAVSGLLCVVVLTGSMLAGGLARPIAMAPAPQAVPTEAPHEVAMEQTLEEVPADVPYKTPPEQVEGEIDGMEEEGEAANRLLETQEVEQPPALGMEGAKPTTVVEAVVTATAWASGTVVPPEAPALSGGQPPTATLRPTLTPAPEETGAGAAAEIAPSPPADQGIPPTPQPSPEERRWRAALISPLWPIVGGLALLTLGLAAASGLAWRAWRR